MKVSSLIAKLSTLDPDAEVLLISGCADISEAEELRRVEPQVDWRCEVRFRDDGLSQSLHAPSHFGVTSNYDEQYDRSVAETVVLLAGRDANLDYMFEGDFAPDVRELNEECIEDEVLRSRRGMLEDGTLISRELLLRLLSITAEQLDGLVAQGSIFDICVDGVSYYPSIFANPRINAERLQSVSRLVQPVDASSRLDFLLTEWGHLGGRRPIEMLDYIKDYRRVRNSAMVRAQESMRTVVKFFEGQHEEALLEAEPLYRVAAELDPRMPLWRRAGATLTEFGFEYPFAPYPQVNVFTAFIEKSFEGESGTVFEGRVCVHRVDGGWRIFAAWPLGDTTDVNETLRCGAEDIVSVAKVAFEYLKRLAAKKA
ncbi:hypothetical protein CBA19CS22_11610 [Caballeronia novacaledonica]|uniref:Uncharacterized protein n=1 Tax=Caballeronia novacaledonica TaxID=1544861 RepID=A0ACB5QQJ8_9BURK|nr:MULTISPECIES: hypothetical protein [Caballeronia]MDR5746756.1 hypothetical protein [Caballeronia sp. LZ029]GJH12617.1 hypothetical protein CBA19CS11_27285 [Caballeronia novacaledonica]GJH17186.1 hypothetical protein CBA19CS22_11610 [Caballeronia novacaledonica]